MADIEQKLKEHFKSEADHLLFRDIHFNSALQQNVLQQIRSEHPARFNKKIPVMRKKWTYRSLAAALVIMLTVSLLQNMLNVARTENPASSLPGTHSNNEGSSLSELKTVQLQTPEEAKRYFGSSLLLPAYIPHGYTLTDIQAVGMDERDATQVIFTYISGEQSLTFVQDKKEASLPLDFFEPTQVSGFSGYIHADPGITELYWIADGIQLSIVGPISKEEAMKIAESLQSS